MVSPPGSVSPTKQGSHEAKGAQSFSFFSWKSSTDRDAYVHVCFLAEELTENVAGKPITFGQLS